jgi:hypothetical protein
MKRIIVLAVILMVCALVYPGLLVAGESYNLELKCPNNGEQWGMYTYQDIIWETDLPGYVTKEESAGMTRVSMLPPEPEPSPEPQYIDIKIEYSRDDFQSDIHLIATVRSRADRGSYTWRVPLELSHTVKVRVSDAQNPAICAISKKGFTVTWNIADLNLDQQVDILDLSFVARLFSTKKGESNYNPIADLDEDGIIDIVDLCAVAREFGNDLHGIQIFRPEPEKTITTASGLGFDIISWGNRTDPNTLEVMLNNHQINEVLNLTTYSGGTVIGASFSPCSNQGDKDKVIFLVQCLLDGANELRVRVQDIKGNDIEATGYFSVNLTQVINSIQGLPVAFNFEGSPLGQPDPAKPTTAIGEARGVTITGATFVISATVTISAVSITATDRWELGFFQNVISDTEISIYKNSITETKVYRYIRPELFPILNGPGSGVPITDTKKSFSPITSTLTVNFKDTPTTSLPWDLQELLKELSIPIPWGGELTGITFRREFITWLIARNKDTGEFECLHWWHWHLLVGAPVDPTKPVKERVTILPGAGIALESEGEHNKGSGVEKPKIDPPMANDPKSSTAYATYKK